ncbi:MAG TPA: ABC transporter permease [Dongiaceae bacterium]|nr:ABC transporter permease [Dongiaceae bacterium]
MGWLKKTAYRLQPLFRRRKIESELSDEIRTHLEMMTEANIAAGMSPEEAHYAARRQFGGVEQIKERYRDQRGIPWIEKSMGDIRYSVRQLRRSPGFAVVAILTLAMGIGVNTTAFTVLYRLPLHRLPYPEPDRLIRVFGASPQIHYKGRLSPGNFCDLRAQTTVFQEIAAAGYMDPGSLTEPGQPPQQVNIAPVSAGYLNVLGISPAMGRSFTADEEAHREREAILSNRFWINHFGADPHIVGRTIRINAVLHSIVGVMPPVLDDPLITAAPVGAWTLDCPAENSTVRDEGRYLVIGRLKPGVSLVQAQEELNAIALRLEHDYPKENAKRTFNAEQYSLVMVDNVTKRLSWLVMAVTSAVLVIVCVNLANLQLVRTTSRGREYAIRMALGSSRGRIVRQVLIESFLLSSAGGALGLLVAKWGNGVLEKYVTDYLLGVDFPINVRVMGFAFAVSAMTGVAFGAIPAWIATGADLNAALKQSARVSSSDRSRHRLRQTLIVSELALALALLAGAGYFVTGMSRLLHRDLGWQPDNLLNGFINLAPEKYGNRNDPRLRNFQERLLAQLEATPGVRNAAVSMPSPMLADDNANCEFAVEGRPAPLKGQAPQAFSINVTPGWFGAMGIRILQGRNFDDGDRLGAPRVAIISQSMATQFWPGENAVGKRIGNLDSKNPDWTEVVGVVADITGGNDFRLGRVHYDLYRPIAQNCDSWFFVTVRTETESPLVQDSVRRAVAKVEPDLAIALLTTARGAITGHMSRFFIVSQLLVELAVLGLILSAAGIYGVIANLAAERTQEIGIRMALGAQARDVLWLVLGNAIRLAAIGTVIGLALAFVLATLLAKTMPDVPGRNPLVTLCLAGLLIGVALLASWLPAQKATELNPVDALRAE